MPYIPSLTQTAALKDIAPGWRWVVVMPDLNPQVFSNMATYQGLVPVTTAPFGFVHQISFATRTIDSEQRFYNGIKQNFPRWQSVSNASISFYETMDYEVMQYIRSWMNLVVDDDGNYGMPAGYKFPINLFAFDYVNNTAPSMVGTLLGTWPTGPGVLSYAYDDSGPVVITADFCVDNDKVTLSGGVSGVSAIAGLAASSFGSGNSIYYQDGSGTGGGGFDDTSNSGDSSGFDNVSFA